MISYIGGKYRQAKWIAGFYPQYVEKYAEVFGGAMWVYINSNLNADEVYYNDYNPFMSNLFACCKEYKEFIPQLDIHEAQIEEKFYEFKEEILAVKNQPISMPDFNIGVKYVYLVTQCFSGIMSENVKFVDLKGKYKSKYYSFLDRLKKSKIQEKLDKLIVSNLSYKEFIEQVDDENMYLYLDPPYYKTEDLYAFHDFGFIDHQILAEVLQNCESSWALSYYEYPQLNDWYPKEKYNWITKDYKKASMASKGKKQSVGRELLVYNFDLQPEGFIV